MSDLKTFFLVFLVLALMLIIVGCSGQKGDPGSPGESIVGPSGPAGADGTIISVVPLCPGTTTYPGVFVEVAMCINNELYAVYSTPGAFLTKLPPGNYTSNAIGSACNLTVLPNCEIQ